MLLKFHEQLLNSKADKPNCHPAVVKIFHIIPSSHPIPCNSPISRNLADATIQVMPFRIYFHTITSHN